MYTDQNVSCVPDKEEVATLCFITEAQRKTWPFYWVVKSGDADIMLSDHCKMQFKVSEVRLKDEWFRKLC